MNKQSIAWEMMLSENLVGKRFSKKELDIKEKLYINLYNSNDDLYGYNRTIGGESFEKGGDHHNAKKVYCVTFDKIFNSIIEAEDYYENISKGAISKMVRGEQNRVIINGINTVWCYLEDYKNMTKDDIDLLIYNFFRFSMKNIPKNL